MENTRQLAPDTAKLDGQLFEQNLRGTFSYESLRRVALQLQWL
jgi:hypothetical protein